MSAIPELSEDDIQGITDAVSTVMRERFFGSDEDKAVFKINEEIGREDFEGTGTYKLNVGVDKDNFISFLESFEPVVKDTKLKDVFEMSSPGQSIDDILDFGSISETFKDTDFSDFSADVWVEGNGNFIRNVRVYPLEDKKDTNYLDFLLPYEGGDVFPLTIRATIDDDGTKGTVLFGADINQNNGDTRLSFDVNLVMDGSPISAIGELKIENSDEDIIVEEPTDVKNVLELVNQATGALQSVAPGLSDDALLPSDFSPIQLDDREVPIRTLGL
jgi:hypothetical protein